MSSGNTKGGFSWREGGNFAELARLGDLWEVSYGFEATEKDARRVVRSATTPEYGDAVRQLWQIIGYYFAAPEHAERVRLELLGRAGLDGGESKYLPLPDVKFLTGAGGGAGGEDQAEAERERRARILRGDAPEGAPAPPAAGEPGAGKRPWWKRIGKRQ